MPSSNVRYRYYSKRERIRAQLLASSRPCAICGKPIDYSLDWWVDPKDGKRKRHPMSFEVDEIVPVSRFRDGGYSSAGECATDPDNCRPTHRICNQRRGNAKLGSKPTTRTDAFPLSARW